MAWKTAKSRNGKKMEIEMGKRPQARKGQKMAKKWPKTGFLREFSIIFPFLGHFLVIFAPVQLGAVFHFDFHFFFHFRLLAVFHAIPARQDPNAWWTFRTFFILFLCSGEGKGESGATREEGGVRFLIENPRRGSVSQGGGGRGGREGVCGELGGGGLNIFFSGRNVHQVGI